MSKFENNYDEQTGTWTTAGDRYEALLRSWNEYRQLHHRGYDDAATAWTDLLWLVGEVAEADDPMFDHVGAGPVEDFVRRHGEEYIDRIEAEAASNPRFLRSLSHIWLSEGDLPHTVFERLLRATGGAIPVFPRSHPLSEDA